LALDDLLGTGIVLADDQIVFADSSQNSELFWAIQRGGGNLGVVTSLLIRLHPVQRVLDGFILFPFAEATSVLTGYCKFAVPLNWIMRGVTAEEKYSTRGHTRGTQSDAPFGQLSWTS